MIILNKKRFVSGNPSITGKVIVITATISDHEFLEILRQKLRDADELVLPVMRSVNTPYRRGYFTEKYLRRINISAHLPYKGLGKYTKNNEFSYLIII